MDRSAAKRRRKDVPADDIGGTVGIWFNKRSVIALELPIRHEITAQNNGSLGSFLEPGKISVETIQGVKRLDVEPGDYFISSGEDLYVALLRSGEEPEELDEDDEEAQPQERNDRPKKPRAQRPVKGGPR